MTSRLGLIRQRAGLLRWRISRRARVQLVDWDDVPDFSVPLTVSGLGVADGESVASRARTALSESVSQRAWSRGRATRTEVATLGGCFGGCPAGPCVAHRDAFGGRPEWYGDDVTGVFPVL